MSDFEKVVTGLGEECGVFGAYDMDGQDVASSIYYGLFALQHRGQESCGIAVTDTYGQRQGAVNGKGLGHVDDVFNEETLHELKGNLGVGHVRYSTAGGTRVENAQPLVINYVKGTLAIAHNGIWSMQWSFGRNCQRQVQFSRRLLIQRLLLIMWQESV